MRAQRRRTDKVTVHAWIASHSRDISAHVWMQCHDVAVFCPSLVFTSGSTPPPNSFLTVLSVVQAALSFPNVRTTPPELCWPFTKCLRYQPPASSWHARTDTCRCRHTYRARGGDHSVFPFDFAVSTAVRVLCNAASSRPNMNTSRLNSTHHASCLDQQTCSRVLSWFCATSLCKFTACCCEVSCSFFNNVYIFSGSLMQG